MSDVNLSTGAVQGSTTNQVTLKTGAIQPAATTSSSGGVGLPAVSLANSLTRPLTNPLTRRD